jgi:hypothetical protein
MNSRTLTIATAALVCQACVIETADPRGEGDAALSARWSLRNMRDGAITDCPAGFDTVQLIAQPAADDPSAVDRADVDLFDCRARAGTSKALNPDRYRVWLEVRSHDLADLYAQSLSQVIDVRRADQQVSFDLLNDGGYFQLSWDLVGGTTHRALDCSQVGADSITAISTSVADARRAYADTRACEDHTTVTGGLLQGAYTVSIDAIFADRSIGKAASLTNQVISGQNRVTDLGQISIAIDGQ